MCGGDNIHVKRAVVLLQLRGKWPDATMLFFGCQQLALIKETSVSLASHDAVSLFPRGFTLGVDTSSMLVKGNTVI